MTMPRPDPPDDNESPATEQWRCMNCGQLVFVAVGSDPPDICQYCNDMTTWQLTEG